jgi:hypothetical protein
MRQGEYWEAILAWSEDRNAERRHTAEVIRAVGVRLFNIQLKKDDRMSPHDFLPFPWDEESADPGALENMTKEERKKNLEKFLEKIDW